MSFVGHLVRAAAGRDKGGLFCVLDEQGDYLLLADGKRRKVEKPKRKKRKHAVLVENAALYGGPVRNRAVHAYIREQQAALSGRQQPAESERQSAESERQPAESEGRPAESDAERSAAGTDQIQKSGLKPQLCKVCKEGGICSG